MRSPQARIEDMLQAIENIERHAPTDKAAFAQDEVLQVYVVHHLMILGEAAYKLPESFRREYPQVPWNAIIGMRHILVHDYFRVDIDIAWEVVEDDLSVLKPQLQRILSKLT